MRHINDLPNEVLVLIFEQVDPKTPSHILRVNQRWFEVGRVGCFRDLRLSAKQFVGCPLNEIGFQKLVMHIKLDFGPYFLLHVNNCDEEARYVRELKSLVEERPILHAEFPTPEIRVGDLPNRIMVRLGFLARQLPRVQNLKTFSLSIPLVSLDLPYHDSLNMGISMFAVRTVARGLPLCQNLKRLELDIRNVASPFGEDPCKDITYACMMTKTLQYVYLRMGTMCRNLFNCAAILKVDDLLNSIEGLATMPFHTLTINMGKKRRQSEFPLIWCHHAPPAPVFGLLNECRDIGVAGVERILMNSKEYMPRLRKARLLHQEAGDIGMCGHDLADEKKFVFVPVTDFQADKHAPGEERTICRENSKAWVPVSGRAL